MGFICYCPIFFQQMDSTATKCKLSQWASGMVLFYFLSQTIDISKLKLIHFEKATKFCEISIIDLTGTTKDKHKLVISQKIFDILTKPQL